MITCKKLRIFQNEVYWKKSSNELGLDFGEDIQSHYATLLSMW